MTEPERKEKKREFCELKKKMHDRIRTLIKKKARGRMEKIEHIRHKDTKQAWKLLKKYTGEAQMKRAGLSVVVDEDGKQFIDRKNVKEVVKKAWANLGLENKEDKKFDKDFLKLIELEMSRKKEEREKIIF